MTVGSELSANYASVQEELGKISTAKHLDSKEISAVFDQTFRFINSKYTDLNVESLQDLRKRIAILQASFQGLKGTIFGNVLPIKVNRVISAFIYRLTSQGAPRICKWSQLDMKAQGIINKIGEKIAELTAKDNLDGSRVTSSSSCGPNDVSINSVNTLAEVFFSSRGVSSSDERSSSLAEPKEEPLLTTSKKDVLPKILEQGTDSFFAEIEDRGGEQAGLKEVMSILYQKASGEVRVEKKSSDKFEVGFKEDLTISVPSGVLTAVSGGSLKMDKDFTITFSKEGDERKIFFSPPIQLRVRVGASFFSTEVLSQVTSIAIKYDETKKNEGKEIGCILELDKPILGQNALNVSLKTFKEIAKGT